MALTKATYSMVDGAPANVLDFGADPTGVADSTSAIQAAIDSGAATVFIPKGEYLCSTISISGKRGLKIYGEPNGSNFVSRGTILKASGVVAKFFDIYATRDSVFQDLMLHGNDVAATVVSITTLNATNSSTNLEFDRVIIRSGTAVGLAIGDGTVNQTSEISFNQCSILLSPIEVYHQGDNTTDITWKNSNIGYTNSTTAYKIAGGGAVQFFGCNFLTANGGESILVYSAVGTNIPGNVVVPRSVDLFGCLTETPGFFISTEDSPSSINGYPNVTQISLHGCRVYKPNNAACLRARTDFPVHYVISGMTFDGPSASTLVGLATPSVQVADLYGCTYMQAQTQPTPSGSIRIWNPTPTSYTSNWTATLADPTLGDGAITAHYRLEGSQCVVTIKLAYGSTSTVGTGTWKFSLPFEAKSGINAVGSAVGATATNSWFNGSSVVGALTGDYTNLRANIGNATLVDNFMSSTQGTWASGDYAYFQIAYDLA